MKGISSKSLIQTLFVQGAVIVYSFCGVFQKLAAGYPTLSIRFILAYGCSVGVLGVYAILWQIILKRVPLSTAYSNRAIAMIWSVVWGVLLYKETITWKQVLGAVIICIGVYLVNQKESGEDEVKNER